jgi:nucleoside-diphosphate-sugar epimerase
MSIFVIGGTGFIGQRVIRHLTARGEEVVVMDINPTAADFSDLGKQVKVIRGDVTEFEDVMRLTTENKPSRMINLSYLLGSDHAPRIAMRLNILGMDNCFEAARLNGVQRVVYASSLAVSGLQTHFGDRAATEDDYRYGNNQYAMHKIFNEWQAQDYIDKYGLSITGVRPANVTGPDKVRGSVDHVQCITQPAAGKSITFKYKDYMRCPIHVDDISEVFVQVLMADGPKHNVYNSGGEAISLGALADLVREFIPEAQITFENETGGKETSGNYLIDNRRLLSEFEVEYAPFRQRVMAGSRPSARDSNTAVPSS